MLPPNDRAAEDALVAQWSTSEDLDGLVALVVAAVQARRPALAARLVGLLPEDLDEAPAELRRARAAARLVLVPDAHAAGPVWAELEDAVLSLQRRRVQRFKERQRKAHRPQGAVAERRRPVKTRGR